MALAGWLNAGLPRAGTQRGRGGGGGGGRDTDWARVTRQRQRRRRRGHRVRSWNRVDFNSWAYTNTQTHKHTGTHKDTRRKPRLRLSARRCGSNNTRAPFSDGKTSRPNKDSGLIRGQRQSRSIRTEQRGLAQCLAVLSPRRQLDCDRGRRSLSVLCVGSRVAIN
jgi:hypothetical protein